MTNIEDSAHRRRRWALIGGISGGVVLVAGLAGLVVVGLGGGDAQPTEPAASSQPNSSTAAPEPTPTESGEGAAPVTTENGWVAEPETSDPREYAAAAVEAVYTYDSTASTRDEFQAYLASWFDIRPGLSEEQFEGAEELRASSLSDVVLDIAEWDQQRLAETKQVAAVETERMILDGDHADGGPQQQQLDLGIHQVSVPVRILYDEVDISTGEPVQYDYRLIQTLQVVCGNEEIPRDRSLAPGSCKVVRFWDEPAA